MNGKIRDIFRFVNPIFPCSPIRTRFHLSSSSSSSSTLSPATERISIYHPSLLPLQTCQTMSQLYQIQAHLITSGLFQNPIPAGLILKISSEFGHVDYTILVFRNLFYPDTFCVNTVIKAYSKAFSQSDKAVSFYFDMLQKGFFPNSFTFPPLVSSCGEMGSGGKCHGQVIKNGVDNVVPVQNSLIHMYSNFGVMGCAWQLFEGMSDRDLISWNSIVHGYAKLGELGIAHGVFDKMPVRNVVSWNIMISGYLKVGNPGCGLKVFREMGKLGCKENETTVVGVLTACGRSARLKEGKSVHGSFIRKFLKSNLIVDTALIDMYSKCQRVESARRVFDNMLVRNLICWNAMLLGHCIHGSPEDGIALFEEMVGRVDSQDGVIDHNKCKVLLHEGNAVIPNEVTFIGVLCACARSGSLTKGTDYFDQMTNVYGIKPKFAHYWCKANLYAGAGLLEEAEQVLKSFAEENEDELSDSLVWGSLLTSCRFGGDEDFGEKIAMRLIELEPESPSGYLLLLNIYAVAARWEDVAKVREMTKERGVKRIPSCSLVSLNEIVHKFKLRENSQPRMEEVYGMLLDELAQRLKLSTRYNSPIRLSQDFAFPQSDSRSS